MTKDKMLRLDTEFARMTALWRWYEDAMDKATLILAISRSYYVGLAGTYSVSLRQTTMLIDLLHEFSFVARKAIERSEEHFPGVVKYAKELTVHHPWTVQELAKNWPECPRLTEQKFWWVANRIIHSTETMIKERDMLFSERESSGTGQLTNLASPVCFGFQSDLDDSREMHFIHIESFVRAYVGGISPKVEDAIKKRNNLNEGRESAI